MTAPNEMKPSAATVANRIWNATVGKDIGHQIPEPPPAANTSESPTGTEAEVCADIAARQAKGIAKYGQTVAENPIALSQWLQHAYEESLDGAVYLKRAIGKVLDLERELAEAREKIARLPADWTQDSSLETWFPYTAEELKGWRETKKAQADEIERLRGAIKRAVNSASPHPAENPTMYGAWEAMKEALAQTPPAGEGGR